MIHLVHHFTPCTKDESTCNYKLLGYLILEILDQTLCARVQNYKTIFFGLLGDPSSRCRVRSLTVNDIETRIGNRLGEYLLRVV